MRSCDRGLADFNVDHRLVEVSSTTLPFGRGKRFLGSAPKAVSSFGNWQLNGIVTLQRGFPYSITPLTPAVFLTPMGRSELYSWETHIQAVSSEYRRLVQYRCFRSAASRRFRKLWP